MQFLVLGLFSAFYGVLYFANDIQKWADNYSVKPRAQSLFTSSDIFDTCVLQEFPADGWTDEMRNKTGKVSDPISDCNRNFTPYTYFENGIVHLAPFFENETGISCRAREILHVDDSAIALGEWRNISERPVFTADFVNVECDSEILGENIYEFIHSQVYRKKSIRKPTSTGTQWFPGVHIILLDSVANTQGIRSLPKTVKLLREELGAVNFRHLNKVGSNSRPNGIAAFWGKTISDYDKSLFGLGVDEADWNETTYCKSYFDSDDDPFALKQFEKMGYTAMFSEDWSSGVLNWPGCWGYKNPPVQHYMRPFQLYYDKNANLSKEIMARGNCFEEHMFQIDYLEQFIGAYHDVPKATLTWSSRFTHDYSEVVFSLDEQYHDMFIRNLREFDNSFVFFMGDHGLRWGSTRYTKQGEVEVNNPMLFLSVPKFLRSEKELMRNLNDNSGKLLTMFDIYATLFDLFTALPATRYKHFGSVLRYPDLRGFSLFRQLPDFPRNCKTLPVPFEFCLCHYERQEVKDQEIVEEIGIGVEVALNNKLFVENISEYCHLLKYTNVSDVTVLAESGSIYQATVTMTPGGGEFKVFVKDEGNGRAGPRFTVAEDGFPRVNSYGSDADCLHGVNDQLRPICYCKNNIQSTTSPA